MRRLWIGLLVLAVACGQAQAQPANSLSPNPTQSSSPTLSPHPSGSSPLLFAALEANGAASPLGWNTVAIAGLDGYARAKTTFTPMPTPYVGCAGAVLPLSAHVAAGKVFFADGTGVIRSLSVAGQLTQVATFPLTSTQQMLSFAVSPDGGRLLGAVFSLPPKSATGDPCSGSPMFGPGNFSLDVYSAQAGGTSRLLYHQTLPTSSTSPAPNTMAFIGWDSVGPLGTYPTEWATQGGGPMHYFGTPVRIDPATGIVGSPVSDPQSCLVQDVAPSGDFACVPVGSTGAISVRRPDNTEIWRFAAPPQTGYQYAFLAPDEQHVVALGSGSEVLARGGTEVKLQDTFQYDGWLDSNTVIGGGFNSNLNYVRLNDLGTVVDIGFIGLFVGTVQG